MYIIGGIFLSMLAALGVALAFLDFMRRGKAKKANYVCICFTEEFDKPPDMVVICRTDAEQEEIIRRIGEAESRRIYIKYL